MAKNPIPSRFNKEWVGYVTAETDATLDKIVERRSRTRRFGKSDLVREALIALIDEEARHFGK